MQIAVGKESHTDEQQPDWGQRVLQKIGSYSLGGSSGKSLCEDF